MAMKAKNRKTKRDSGNTYKDRRNYPTISLCMIVRDEAKHITGCLKSVRNIVDEMIVVDTGSADGTPEIAIGLGAKVYRHPWQDDFSLHRNQSIGYTSGDWILILDADERLEEKSVQKIRKSLRNSKENAIAFRVISYTDEKGSHITANSPRLFRNHSGFHYDGIVHNQARFQGPCRFSYITIYHYGYLLDEKIKRKKAQRTKTLLLTQIQSAPEDPMPYANLAKAHMALGDSRSFLGREESRGAHQVERYQRFCTRGGVCLHSKVPDFSGRIS